MGINIRQKGQEGEREVARAMNSIVEAVLKAHGMAIPTKPVIQRNQNQSAVGGSDLSNPFGLSPEVKRQETLSINTWWKQCIQASLDFGGTPVLLYRQNGKRDWNVIMMVDVPLTQSSHVRGVRAQMDWQSFLQWFYALVDYKIRQGEWSPVYE